MIREERQSAGTSGGRSAEDGSLFLSEDAVDDVSALQVDGSRGHELSGPEDT